MKIRLIKHPAWTWFWLASCLTLLMSIVSFVSIIQQSASGISLDVILSNSNTWIGPIMIFIELVIALIIFIIQKNKYPEILVFSKKFVSLYRKKKQIYNISIENVNLSWNYVTLVDNILEILALGFDEGSLIITINLPNNDFYKYEIPLMRITALRLKRKVRKYQKQLKANKND